MRKTLYSVGSSPPSGMSTMDPGAWLFATGVTPAITRWSQEPQGDACRGTSRVGAEASEVFTTLLVEVKRLKRDPGGGRERYGYAGVASGLGAGVFQLAWKRAGDGRCQFESRASWQGGGSRVSCTVQWGASCKWYRRYRGEGKGSKEREKDSGTGMPCAAPAQKEDLSHWHCHCLVNDQRLIAGEVRPQTC